MIVMSGVEKFTFMLYSALLETFTITMTPTELKSPHKVREG